MTRDTERTAEKPSLAVAQIVRPASGGMRRHLSLLLAYRDRERIAPTLFAPPGFTLDAPNAAVPVRALPIPPRFHPLRDAACIRQLAQELRGKFDLAHAHGIRGAMIGIPAAQRAGIPSLVTLHNLLPRMSLPLRFVLARLLQRAAAIIAVSQAVAETARSLGVPEDRIHVIPNGIPCEDFQDNSERDSTRAALQLPAEASLILGVGRLSPEKGFDVLIRAVGQLQRDYPTARLLLVGSGPMEAELRALAAEVSDPAHPTAQDSLIRFAGQQARIAPYLHAADLVAVPSREEGQGIVALEAMAAGKAVVASQVGGLPETVLAGETGELVPPDDVSALAHCLHPLLRDEKRRQILGENGRRRVEAEFTVERMTARTEALYRSIRGIR